MCEILPPKGLFLFDNNTAFEDLLPATFRTTDDHIEAPSLHQREMFFDKDLLVPRLNAIQSWLRICGRPMPPRPLHHQVVMSRDIVVTEQIDMHLVWFKNRIFVKPLPAYLLHCDFWRGPNPNDPTLQWDNRKQCAWGLIFSYMALIAYPSDFDLAMQQGLIPSTVTWEKWRKLSTEVLARFQYSTVNPRFWYGELRLSRLNLVYALSGGWLFRGFSRIGGAVTYEDLLRDNFAALATVLGYIVIVLTAIQAGLAIDRLQHDINFQNASYGFTIFSIIAPLIGALALLVVIFSVFLSNLIATRTYEVKRFQEMRITRDTYKM
ncbi:hypothetical protein BDV28DRAFT_42408 [Aspergillus coremiiformis]|uniref:Uncharacterized protein n=1 Tax=Aspergillus coremiiformis TaxID=138285 RepID=A0A5N6ZCQ0_9EURO|nr:hypothetical protein BDV28DRAFT_42408 [Aspergillus coremiiformis]